MNKIHIAGIGGVLGSTLAENLKDEYEIQGNDIKRINEAWRLDKDLIDEENYIWKSSFDLDSKDLEDVDVVFDCGLPYADRPFGTESPKTTMFDNLKPAMGLLEAVRGLKEENLPICIYASSFNVFYGSQNTLVEDHKLTPSTVYGWSKASAELLYQSYYRSFGIPVIISRVGSAFGPKGRSDEMVHNIIIKALKDEDKYLWSPKAKRLWCYAGDVMKFYKKLLNEANNHIGSVLHCAGNKNTGITTNLRVASIIKELTNSNMEIIKGEYEDGELIDGEPITFEFDSSKTRELLGWKPQHTLKEGLKKTISWFEDNLWRYS